MLVVSRRPVLTVRRTRPLHDHMQLRFSVSLSLGHDHHVSALFTTTASAAALQYRTALERRRRRYVGPLAPLALLVPRPTHERDRKRGHGHHGHERQVPTAHQTASAASAAHRAMRLVVLLRLDQLTKVSNPVVVGRCTPRGLLNYPTGTVRVPWIVRGEGH